MPTAILSLEWHYMPKTRGCGVESTQRLFARKLFRLRAVQAKGMEFQRLFEQIMAFHCSSFTPINPYGKYGDRKNDGYNRETGCFYQVHAPDDPSKSETVLAAASKAKADFEGMLTAWSGKTPVNEYRFVFNDDYRGCPAPVEEALLEVTNKHGVAATAMLCQHLEDIVLKLDDDQIMLVVQAPIPTANPLPSIDFSILGEVINHILSSQQPISQNSILEAPTFDSKIEFNGLTQHVADLLRVGSYQHDAVAKYFSRNSTYAKQELRNHIAAMHNDARTLLAGSDCDSGNDIVFFETLRLITPNGPIDSAAEPSHHKLLQDAALVVMAFFFESCDIFEAPNATS